MKGAARLLFVVNQFDFFKSHRMPLATAAIDAGYEVHVATAACETSAELTALGIVHHVLPLQRRTLNPLSDLVLLWSLFRLFLRLRPQVVHLVTIKPVIYGGIVARCLRVPVVIAAISGLGFVFIQHGGPSRVLQRFVKLLYRFALGGARVRVIFQNPDDMNAFKTFAGLRDSQTVLISGAGVSLQECSYTPEPAGVVVVIMAARLLADKGVFEYVGAAELLRQKGVGARFCLAGDLDPGNPSTCSEDNLKSWRNGGAVELLGYHADIPRLFSSCHIVVLPSYREGMPKVLLEAAACGRAVVTTDVPGCRDAIEPNVTGLLVAPRDMAGLADAIERLILDGATRRLMGEAGRRKAEREFDIAQVVARHLQLYNNVVA